MKKYKHLKLKMHFNIRQNIPLYKIPPVELVEESMDITTNQFYQ
jgi:hypothetical protein